jgi:hypothetical protein
MTPRPFSARIRWQSDADPCYELETHHPGFATADDAALFANGFSAAGADELRLSDGALVLTLTDGSQVELPLEVVQVWRLQDDGQEIQVADDIDFQLAAVTFEELSSQGLDGGFVQVKYGVLDPDNEPLDVAVYLDETGLLGVTVHARGQDEGGEASFALGVITRA